MEVEEFNKMLKDDASADDIAEAIIEETGEFGQESQPKSVVQLQQDMADQTMPEDSPMLDAFNLAYNTDVISDEKYADVIEALGGVDGDDDESEDDDAEEPDDDDDEDEDDV